MNNLEFPSKTQSYRFYWCFKQKKGSNTFWGLTVFQGPGFSEPVAIIVMPITGVFVLKQLKTPLFCKKYGIHFQILQIGFYLCFLLWDSKVRAAWVETSFFMYSRLNWHEFETLKYRLSETRQTQFLTFP